VEQQEVKYGFSTLHTLTKGVSTVHGLKKANNGQTGKHLERVGMLNRGTMVYAYDPHSKKGGWVVGDQQHLIEQTERIYYYYLERGVDPLTIRNRLYNLEASAVAYKYRVAPELCEHPDIKGLFHNCNQSKSLRNMARQNVLSVPTTPLLPESN
jgi:hypothetical protein